MQYEKFYIYTARYYIKVLCSFVQCSDQCSVTYAGLVWPCRYSCAASTVTALLLHCTACGGNLSSPRLGLLHCCTVYSAQCTVHSEQCTVSVHCTTQIVLECAPPLSLSNHTNIFPAFTVHCRCSHYTASATLTLATCLPLSEPAYYPSGKKASG